jgi:hypothetical protein
MTAGSKVHTNHWNSEEQLNRKHLKTMRLSDMQWNTVKQLQNIVVIDCVRELSWHMSSELEVNQNLGCNS